MSIILNKVNFSKTIGLFHLNELINMTRGMFVEDLRILAYHRVCNLEDCNDNDIDLISATEEQFDWQMNYLKNTYDLINFDYLERILNKEVKKPKRPVIVTFDDGFTDNYTKAYPILKKYNVPATFFVSTGYIDTKKNFWFNQVFRSFIGQANLHVTIKYLNIDLILSSVEEVRIEQIYSIIEALKKCPNNKRIELVESIENNYPSRNLNDPLSLPMSWEQVLEMSKSNMEIGSHTINHPVLSTLKNDELRNEITGSKEMLENKLDQKISTIAYPVGMSFAYNDCVIQEVKNAKYKFGVSYVPGNNYFKSLNRFELKRIHVERYTSNSMFKSMLSWPELFTGY